MCSWACVFITNEGLEGLPGERLPISEDCPCPTLSWLSGKISEEQKWQEWWVQFKKKGPPRQVCVRLSVCSPPARRRELGCRLLAWRCPSHFGESPQRIRGHRYNSCGGTLTPGDSSRSETCPPLPGSSDPSQDALVTEEEGRGDERREKDEKALLNTINLFHV